MAAADKKTKLQEKAAPKEKPSVEPKEKPAVEAKEKTETPAKVDAPAEAKAEAPKNYSRGEGQKPVSQAYKDNWNAIFGKKKKKKKR